MLEMKHVEQLIESMHVRKSFEKVHKVMLVLDWKWSSISPRAVPTIEQLIAHTREMGETLIAKQHKQTSLSCGGYFMWMGNPMSFIPGSAQALSSGYLSIRFELGHSWLLIDYGNPSISDVGIIDHTKQVAVETN